jgi:cytochrome c biogenesis protein CcmG/thiol:disulfide interchange protein DsbE
MGRYFIPLAVFVVLVVFLGIGLGLNPRLVPSPLIDKPAPEFALPELKDPNKTVSRSDLVGKVSLVNVWASWCVSCRAEHPLFVDLGKTGEVVIYGLNYKDTRPDALRWLQVLGDPYIASAFDEQGRVGIDWGVYGVPETFVVDRKGVIRYKHIGPVSEKDLQETIMPLVKRLEAEQT